MNNEIKRIQEKLGFSTLNASEEKKFIERKSKLEALRPKVAKFSEIKKKIEVIHSTYKSQFDKLKELKSREYDLRQKLKKLYEKSQQLNDQNKDKDPAVKNLIFQKENIKAEIDKCKKKIKDLEKEYDDKWNKWERQQKLIKYIQDATTKINQLKKRADKEKKRREKENKESGDTENLTETPQQEEEQYGYEIYTCEWLTNYLKNLLPGNNNKSENVNNQVTTQQRSSKIDEDLTKGLIKPINNKDDEFVIGLSSSTGETKKKTKGPKVSKREQKSENVNILVLDINIIQKIKDVGLKPPVHKNEINDFLQLLDKVHSEFKAKSSKVKPVKEEVKPSTTEQQPEHQPKSSPVHEKKQHENNEKPHPEVK